MLRHHAQGRATVCCVRGEREGGVQQLTLRVSLSRGGKWRLGDEAAAAPAGRQRLRLGGGRCRRLPHRLAGERCTLCASLRRARCFMGAGLVGLARRCRATPRFLAAGRRASGDGCSRLCECRSGSQVTHHARGGGLG